MKLVKGSANRTSNPEKTVKLSSKMEQFIVETAKFVCTNIIAAHNGYSGLMKATNCENGKEFLFAKEYLLSLETCDDGHGTILTYKNRCTVIVEESKEELAKQFGYVYEPKPEPKPEQSAEGTCQAPEASQP